MTTPDRRRTAPDRLTALLAGLELAAGGELDRLRALGALTAIAPTAFGGLGLGMEPDRAHDLMAVLRLIGRGNLSVGRLFEGHVNALRLIVRYGTEAQIRSAVEDVPGGHLFGLWVTDAPDSPLRRAEDGVLTGAKFPCSAAGLATRALMTVTTPGGETRMLIAPTPGAAQVDPADWDPHGMRATSSHRVTFDGARIPADALIGGPGDYLRQPEFSAGAWRTLAVTLGGLEALVDDACAALVARARHIDAHQASRAHRRRDGRAVDQSNRAARGGTCGVSARRASATQAIAQAAAQKTGVRLVSYPVWGWLLDPSASLPDADAMRGARLTIASVLPLKKRATAARAPGCLHRLSSSSTPPTPIRRGSRRASMMPTRDNDDPLPSSSAKAEDPWLCCRSKEGMDGRPSPTMTRTRQHLRRLV